ncbi:MAG: hypothetical protein Q7V88_12355 [Actinomycetota bacterium]|nr:hypothetical protein [Actinomycetota bacterium]
MNCHAAVFEHAAAKYRKARELFQRAGDADGVEVIDRQLVQVHEQRGSRS